MSMNTLRFSLSYIFSLILSNLSEHKIGAAALFDLFRPAFFNPLDSVLSDPSSAASFNPLGSALLDPLGAVLPDPAYSVLFDSIVRYSVICHIRPVIFNRIGFQHSIEVFSRESSETAHFMEVVPAILE